MTAKFIKVGTHAELDEVFERSKFGPVVLIKHSNRCGISSHVLEMAVEKVNGDVNIVVIQENRDLSDEVAKRTGHPHQSPQAFVIRNCRAVYHATHYGIDPAAIQKALELK